jgi:hypothetical protein
MRRRKSEIFLKSLPIIKKKEKQKKNMDNNCKPDLVLISSVKLAFHPNKKNTQ